MEEKLKQLLRNLGVERWVAQTTDEQPIDESLYDDAFERAARHARERERQLGIAQRIVGDHHQYYEVLPPGRRTTFLQNSAPIILVALAQDLLARSFSARFQSEEQSLLLARLAREVTEYLGEEGRLPEIVCADMGARAQAYLGNALRVSGDFGAAESAFELAVTKALVGSGDRTLKADILKFRALLYSDLADSKAAAAYFDREISIRRLLGDEQGLGVALLDRGRVECWIEGPTRRACQLIRDGLELVEDRSAFLVGILALAESLAREGRGIKGLLVVKSGDLALAEQSAPRFEVRARWIEGVAYHAVGDCHTADRLISKARADLLQEGATLPAAVATIDLVAVRVDQGKFRQARELAEEAYEMFLAERLEKPAIAALILLRESLELETCTERLPMAVAKFLVRFQYDHRLRFEWSD